MTIRHILPSCLCLLFAISSCGIYGPISTVESAQLYGCDDIVIVDDKLYKDAPNDAFEFVSAEIEDDCLKLTITYTGGCTEPTIQLVENAIILEGYPVERQIRIALDNKDKCEELVTKTISYYIGDLQVSGEKRIALNLLRYTGPPLRYEY